jgi:hypothetical protein
MTVPLAAIWDNVPMANESADGEPSGPICINCHRQLRGNLRSERLDVQEISEGPKSRLGVVYCGACGWPLHIDARSPLMAGSGPAETKVAAPADETTLQGQFQLRCRDLIAEIRALGFDPWLWVDLINDLGAVGAAKRILAEYEVLPVTRWLVGQGHPELTLEREIDHLRWADLFDDSDRSEAVRRLDPAGGENPNH